MKSWVRIGRGNDNDLKLNDISVSRVHAFIRRDPKDGSFFIEDNTSKFGTLV
jgi:pSer/pThr/pTyr-binding forkhead associated (FHA) protein